MDSLTGIAVAAMTLVGVLVSAWFTKRVSDRKLRQDAGLLMIDQLQEENAELRKELAASHRRERLQGDYIGVLRRHIADAGEPPPPAWPAGLIT